MQHDESLSDGIARLHAFLDISLAQLWGKAPGWPNFGANPIGFLRSMADIRMLLEVEGVSVPSIVDPDVDPIACLTEWRDFLAELVVAAELATVH